MSLVISEEFLDTAHTSAGELKQEIAVLFRRTGFVTPSETFVHDMSMKKRFGAGCKPAPAATVKSCMKTCQVLIRPNFEDLAGFFAPTRAE
ncbi:MAG: hypothetical protein GY862_30780 [Gammaproteobacteria bacterium]|nr:hypothetical protein [Gammaproteobacteria bacterium]